MGIGDKLNELLKNRKRNINEVAKAINVSPQTLYSISKRNNTKVDLDILQRVADELSVTLDYFCRDDIKIKSENLRLSDLERNLIIAYRNHPDMQTAVNKMLDISEDTSPIIDDISQEIKSSWDCLEKNKIQD